MIQNNNNPLDLSGAPGEVITVGVAAKGTVKAVAQTLNNAAHTGNHFALGAAGSVTLFTVAVTYSGGGTGRYALTLTGSEGGDISFMVLHEPSVGPKVNHITYTINVH